MKRHFPPLNALHAFEATARLKSFQKAADELNVTRSAVSHQIKKLEQQLGAWYLVQSAQRLADSKVTCFGNWLHHQLAAEEHLNRSA